MRRELATSNFSSFLFSLLIFLLISEIQARRLQQVECSSSCGDIKNISYPFRLKDDPAGCGDHNYELSCQSNKAILELYSGKYHVKRISYAGWKITLVDVDFANGSCSLPHKSLSETELFVVTIIDADETKCLLKTLLSLNVTGSKFAFSQFALNNNQTLALVNCTEKIAQSSSLIEEVVPIDCTSDDKNFAYDSMDALPSNCSRWRTASDPFGFITGRMEMVWEALDGCYGCDKSGNYCGFNFLTSSTI
ncbi:hypothetical protein JRO89_XS05G0245400 [Xanthoceras sorbifolium]|uniref:RING-type E3 ubiquitin transferase n=1 Tax=Xanthoceras sorbifolium TaxID=99658 RepID=A0ABQ8I364_9ROSI|nr:hypothetical protein JRO89_XS05G0245400 [Xanthoceras sorbifolium]